MSLSALRAAALGELKVIVLGARWVVDCAHVRPLGLAGVASGEPHSAARFRACLPDVERGAQVTCLSARNLTVILTLQGEQLTVAVGALAAGLARPPGDVVQVTKRAAWA